MDSSADIQMTCMDLLMRLPPQNVRDNLARLFPLVDEEVIEGVLSSVDQPFLEMTCTSTNKKFLGCDYNRDADSYRSPWSNTYQPTIDSISYPSPTLRELEILANRAFDLYRDAYYDNSGVSSVYLWDNDNNDFSGVVLLKRGCQLGGCSVRGCWDSLHVFEVKVKQVGKNISATYSFTSTLMLWLETEKDGGFKLDLSGSLNFQKKQEFPVPKPNSHIANIGTMVEALENSLRSSLSSLYFGKTKLVVTQLRSYNTIQEENQKKNLQAELFKSVSNKNRPS